MGWVHRWRLRRAAKQYARKLGSHLRLAYGAAEHFTAPQIRAGVAKLGMASKYIALGYAAYLPEGEFEAAADNAPIRISRDLALDVLRRYRPSDLGGSSNYYESGLGMVGGGPGHTGPGGSP